MASPPTDKVLNMKKKGYTTSQVIDSLRRENYDDQEINDALNQAEIKTGVEIPEPPSPSEPQFQEPNFTPQEPIYQQPDFPSPQPYNYPEPVGRASIEQVEEIVESVVREKWDDLIRNIGDIVVFKDKVKTELISIKQELLRTQERFENLQKAVIGKVAEYNKGLSTVSTDITALEKVFEKILVPLTTNIRELKKVTTELKGKTRKSKKGN